MAAAHKGRILVVFEDNVTDRQKRSILRGKRLRTENGPLDSMVLVRVPKAKENLLAENLSLLHEVREAKPGPKIDVVIMD